MASGLRIGTRGSALAITQAQAVADMLGGAEIVRVTTSGDRGKGAAGADKSRWVDAIEDALLASEIDLAVHSAKDVPVDLTNELVGGFYDPVELGQRVAERLDGVGVRDLLQEAEKMAMPPVPASAVLTDS